MKGADDMIGLVLGAGFGQRPLWRRKIPMQIDSRTRKRYAKAFAMEQEAHSWWKQRSRQQIML